MDTKHAPPAATSNPSTNPSERGVSRRWKLVIGALVLVLVAFVGLGELFAARVLHPRTPEVLQRVLDAGARIGSSDATFVKALATSSSSSVQAGGRTSVLFAPCSGSGVSQVRVTFAAGSAVAITYTPCGRSQPPTVSFSQARRFLPPDASAHASAFVTFRGARAYSVRSAMLARELAPSDFTDCAGRAVAPGTTSFALTARGGWVLAAGTCPQLR